jgi:hypothetical protein
MYQKDSTDRAKIRPVHALEYQEGARWVIVCAIVGTISVDVGSTFVVSVQLHQKNGFRRFSIMTPSSP